MDERVFGLHAVEALLAGDPARVRSLHVLDARDDARLHAVIEHAEAHGVRIERTTRKHLDRLASGGRHQGAVALCASAEVASERELEFRWPQIAAPQLVLALDGVTDPRNLGACLRCADAAGVHAVLLPKHRSAPLSDVARKAASGAAESSFVVHVTNLARMLRWLKEQGVWIVGADSETTRSYRTVDYRRPTALVLGGEAEGMRRLTRELCDELVSIPMRGRVASLNVSVAAGVLLYEVDRQRSG
jgi:23S rRNA (guanosine2251-2'-O)-methyltransferase